MAWTEKRLGNAVNVFFFFGTMIQNNQLYNNAN